MGATADYNRPAWTNPIDEDLDYMRDNFHFLLCLCAVGIPILPGWNTIVDVSTNSDYAKPDGYTLTHANGREIYIQLQWIEKTYTAVSPNVTRNLISQMTLGYEDGVTPP